jgi:hypothetical protein
VLSRTSGISLPGRTTARALLLVIAAIGAAPAHADLLTTRQTLENFSFLAGAIEYAPDPRTFTLPTDGAFAFTATDPDLGYRAADSKHDSLRGSLHIVPKSDNYGNFLSADFNIFGSLPALSNQTEARLNADAVQSLRPDSKPDGLAFLSDHERIIGPLASRYRGAGVFMLVVGVDDQTWVQGFADGANTMQLLDAEDGVAKGTASPEDLAAIPLPATAWLLIAGLPLALRRRLRNAG